MLTLQALRVGHEEAFIAATNMSKSIHEPWLSAPTSSPAFRALLRKSKTDNNRSFVAIDHAGEIIACVNFNEIVRGSFQSAYLGYHVFALVRSLGFLREGYSPRFLYIDDEWRDHERYAITAEEWAP